MTSRRSAMMSIRGGQGAISRGFWPGTAGAIVTLDRNSVRRHALGPRASGPWKARPATSPRQHRPLGTRRAVGTKVNGRDAHDRPPWARDRASRLGFGAAVGHLAAGTAHGCRLDPNLNRAEDAALVPFAKYQPPVPP